MANLNKAPVNGALCYSGMLCLGSVDITAIILSTIHGDTLGKASTRVHTAVAKSALNRDELNFV